MEIYGSHRDVHPYGVGKIEIYQPNIKIRPSITSQMGDGLPAVVNADAVKLYRSSRSGFKRIMAGQCGFMV